MVKVITLLKKKDGMTQEEFSRYWLEKHGPLIAKVFPGVRRYVQNHLVRTSQGEDTEISGVAENWYDDQESWQTAVDFYLSDAGKVIRDDEAQFIESSRMTVIFAEEKVIIE